MILSVAKIKKYLYIIDFYQDQHNYAIKESMMLKKTAYRGFFTLIFFSFVAIAIGLSIIQYDLNNIIENKSFVPLLVLETQVIKFSASYFHISTSFHGYGDSCSK